MSAVVLRGAWYLRYALILQLALKAAAQPPEPALAPADVSADVSPRCSPEQSDTSACLWTGDCSRGGCEDRCILNEGTTASYFTLLDRAAGEEFYGACPLLAFWMNKLVAYATSLSPGRRLQSKARIDAGSRLHGAGGSTSRQAWQLDPALLQVAPSARHEAGSRAAARSTHTPDTAAARRRRLLETDFSEAPAPERSASPLGAQSDIPSNLCIEEGGFAVAQDATSALMTVWRRVFAAAAAGEPLEADLQDAAYVLVYPNEHQFLIRMLEDPERTEEYMATRCANREMRGVESLHYIHWLEPDLRGSLDDEGTMVQCADTFGAFQEFDRSYRVLERECAPPFRVTPNCYTEVADNVISSPLCAAAYAVAFNASDLAPLARIAAITEAIHYACGAVESEEECLSAQIPLLQDLQDIHDGLPVPNALEFEAPPPVGPVDPVPVVCFTPECEAEAPAPEVQAPASAAAPAATLPASTQGAREPGAGRLDDNRMLTGADASAGRAAAPAATAVAAAALAIAGAGLLDNLTVGSQGLPGGLR